MHLTVLELAPLEKKKRGHNYLYSGGSGLSVNTHFVTLPFSFAYCTVKTFQAHPSLHKRSLLKSQKFYYYALDIHTTLSSVEYIPRYRTGVITHSYCACASTYVATIMAACTVLLFYFYHSVGIVKVLHKNSNK